MLKNKGLTFDSTSSVEARRTLIEGPVVVRSLLATMDVVAAIVLKVFYFDGESERLLITTSIPALSGSDGVVPSVDLLSEVDSPWVEVDERGNNVLRLGDGDSLRVGVTSLPGAGKRLDVVAMGGDE